MSLADCFAAALAVRVNGDVFTGDPEFREVEDTIRVVWLAPNTPRADGRRHPRTGPRQ
jgi:hypothetical protein